MKASASSQSGKTDAQVHVYLAKLPAPARKAMQELRETIRGAARGARECFGYGMLGFSLDGKPLIWYAAWKRHCSLYPVSNETLRALAAEVERYETTGKGTIQFPLDEPMPTGLVKRLVKARIAELRNKRKKG